LLFQKFNITSQQWRAGAPIPGGFAFGSCSVLGKNPNQFLVVRGNNASIYDAELNTWYANINLKNCNQNYRIVFQNCIAFLFAKERVLLIKILPKVSFHKKCPL
jgi:hypothetical protein